MIKAEIIATGNELLRGTVKNTTTTFLIDQLLLCGYQIARLTTLGDDLEEIKGAIREALNRADLILVTGGLGATPDDQTREAIGEAIQMPLEFRDELWKEIQSYFERQGRATPSANIKQAYLPYGATAVPNALGTAAGIIVRHDSRAIIALPGPPAELRQMFLNEIKPYLLNHFPPQAAYLRRCYKVCGLGETQLLQKLQGVLERAKQLPAEFSYLAKGGEVHLTLQMRADQQAAFAELDTLIRRALGEDLYGTDEETLPGKVGELLRQAGFTLGVAESCTGGLVLHSLTNVPGSSDYLRGGIVAYQNEIKEGLLGVKAETLAVFSAVSPNTAMEMAVGVKQALATDLGLATTGFAGPGGGLPQAPVGTVYVGLATPRETFFIKLFYPGVGRVTIKNMAARGALDLLRRYLIRRGGTPG